MHLTALCVLTAKRDPALTTGNILAMHTICLVYNLNIYYCLKVWGQQDLFLNTYFYSASKVTVKAFIMLQMK